MGTSAYTNVWVQQTGARTCLGDGAETMAAIARGGSGLAQHPVLGWIGQIPHLQSMNSLAEAVATPCWRGIADGSDLPVLIASASKGDTQAWLDGTEPNTKAMLRSLPGQLSGHLARALDIGVHINGSPVAACATGLYGVLEAADYLEAGRSSRALAGAVDCSLQPLLLAGFRSLKVLCTQRPSAMQGEGTGFAPAEGAGFLALTRQPGPWRLLAGVRLGDASHETRCDDHGVFHHLLKELWRLCPEPEAIITHGTGTKTGDAFELAGLASGPWKEAQRVHMKPAIGHCLGASSAVELAVACEGPWKRIWKLALGFGGHLAGVALSRA